MTIFEAYNSTKKKLESAGIEDYIFEAKQIIKHITGFSATQILSFYNRELTDFQKNNLIALVHQREARYPLQYIFGEWEFYGRGFDVGVGVLIPRADTETVVRDALEFLNDRKNPTVLDLCAGSGCIGITIAKEKTDSQVLMVEKHDEALRYAQRNIERNSAANASAVKGDVFESFAAEDKYSLIVSNPPYISQDEMNQISPEVKFEPEAALLAADGGLEFYRAIIKNYRNSLEDGGMLLFEVGYSQSRDVAELMRQNGFGDIKISKDLNGIERAVSGIKQTENGGNLNDC